MIRDLTFHGITFLIFIVLQVFVFNHIVVFDLAFCFIYLGFLIILPHDLDILLGMLLGFITGLIMDTFYSTGAIHAASCTLIMFMRPALMNLINPKSGYEKGIRITISNFGWTWYVPYAGILIFVHHITLFSLDAFNSALIGKAILHTLFSGGFTLLMILSVQMMAFSKQS